MAQFQALIWEYHVLMCYYFSLFCQINNQIYARKKLVQVNHLSTGKCCQKTFVSYGNKKTSKIYIKK